MTGLVPELIEKIVEQVTDMQCWICGENATTREHKIKASDIREHFGNVTQNDPMVRRPEGLRKQYINSYKSPKLTFDTMICAQCNNDRTQPYDRSWEMLSRYFADKNNRLRHIDSGRWEPKRAFPGSAREDMLNVHLYFIKLFGCKILDLGVNLDCSGFSRNLIERIPNKNIYLGFGNTPGLPVGRKFALETTVDVIEETDSKNVLAAFTFYMVGQVAVKIAYSVAGNLVDTKKLWSPFGRRSKYVYFEKSDVVR